MRFLFSLFKIVLINLVAMALFGILAISFLTKEFPPKIKTLKHYAAKIESVQDSYKLLLNKSTLDARKQLGEDAPPDETEFGKRQLAPTEESDYAPAGSSQETLQDPHTEISRLRAEVSRLQEENVRLRAQLPH